MEDKDKKIVVNINGPVDSNKPIEVVLREGTAARAVDPLPVKEPLKCNLEGVITTPANWLEKRLNTVNLRKAYVVVDRENMQIALVVNEDDHYNKRVIKGSVEFSEIYTKFRINEEKGWLPEKLGQFIRLNRSAFADAGVAAELVTKLRKFNADVKVKLEKSNDSNGSRSFVYDQQVTSSLPTEFVINIPLFKGDSRSQFSVEIDHYVDGADCFIVLVSPSANDAVEKFRDSIIDNEIARFKSFATDLVVIDGNLDDNNVK